MNINKQVEMHSLYNALASSSTHQSMKAPGLVDADANSQHRWAMVHKFMRLCWALFLPQVQEVRAWSNTVQANEYTRMTRSILTRNTFLVGTWDQNNCLLGINLDIWLSIGRAAETLPAALGDLWSRASLRFTRCIYMGSTPAKYTHEWIIAWISQISCTVTTRGWRIMSNESISVNLSCTTGVGAVSQTSFLPIQSSRVLHLLKVQPH